jgi:sulfotransferase
MQKMFFNSSMPRSGSELLQVILHQNPLIYASSTSPLLEYQFGARVNYNLPEVTSQNAELMAGAFINMCKGMAHSYYEAITNRPYIIDKNRGWSHYYEWVEQWNPNPKMICMVRDLRSILASFEKIYRKNRHTPSGPDDPAKLQSMTVFQRANYWLNTQPIGLALQRTFDLFQKRINHNILFVRYEDLCNNPEETMNNIYCYLQIEGFSHNFNNIVKKVEENSKIFGVYGDHSIKPQLEKTDINNWKEIYDSSDFIVNQAKWYFEVFNYEV